MNTGPLVSIICPVYNHEKFVGKALEGFLMQETSFPFEIIVHDDASTDNTVLVIKKYEEQFPHLFRNIYQNENQLSQSIDNVTRITFSAARGKYIALCEGDDYWTDPLKLQKLVDVLEKNNKLAIAAHGSYRLTDKLSLIDSPFNVDTIWSTKDILANNWFIMTASVMFRKSMIDLSPDWLSEISQLDLALILLASLNGDGYYTPEPMSVYRMAGTGMMSRFKIKDSKSYIFLLSQFNKRSDYKFDKEITTLQEKIRIDIVHQYIAQNKSINLFSVRYWQNVIQGLKWARIENWPNFAKKLVKGKLSK